MGNHHSNLLIRLKIIKNSQGPLSNDLCLPSWYRSLEGLTFSVPLSELTDAGVASSEGVIGVVTALCFSASIWAMVRGKASICIYNQITRYNNKYCTLYVVRVVSVVVGSPTHNAFPLSTQDPAELQSSTTAMEDPIPKAGLNASNGNILFCGIKNATTLYIFVV